MKNKEASKFIGAGIVLGAGIGGGWGVIFNNLVLGAGIGIGFGVIIGSIVYKIKQ